MNMFYVKDGKLIKYLDSVPEVVSFLEKVVVEKTGYSRPTWMQHIIELGHGADDPSGRTFVDSLQQFVEIGVVRNGRLTRCSIHEATIFQKPEYGN